MTNSTASIIDPVSLIQPRRKVSGISAILLPYLENGEVDWVGFRAHVQRTVEAGLTPGINMDTGYINLLDDETRLAVLKEGQKLLDGKPFIAGAFVKDQTGAEFNGDLYKQRMEEITSHGGTPVIFQSFGLVEQSPEKIVASYQDLASDCDQFIGFELTKIGRASCRERV